MGHVIHLPERFRLLMSGKDEEAVDSPKVGLASSLSAVSRIERAMTAGHRTITGRYAPKGRVFEFNKNGVDLVEIDAMGFLLAEFPGLMSDWGGVIDDEWVPVEVLSTATFAVALFRRKGKRGSGSLVVVRRGMIEVGFDLVRDAGDVGAGLLSVEEEEGAEARRWIAPITAEIVAANMLRT